MQALIQRVKNFIGQWTDTALRAILVVVVGQLARDLLTVHTVADMPSAVGLVDVSLLHAESLSDQGRMCNAQNLVQQDFSLCPLSRIANS